MARKKMTAAEKMAFAKRMMKARKAKSFGKKTPLKKVVAKRAARVSQKPRKIFGRKVMRYIIRANVAERGALIPYYYTGDKFHTEKSQAERYTSKVSAEAAAVSILNHLPYKIRSLQIESA